MKFTSLLLCLLFSVVAASAQPVASKEPTPVKERRARARSLLVALSSDARTFHDQTLRARSLARIADALWQVDGEQARLLFRKAWDAAEVADQDSEKTIQEEIEQQKARTGGSYAYTSPPHVRREVLRLAARRDRALGEEFLEKLKAQKIEATSNKPTPNELNTAQNQRLNLAQELLQAGEVERAIQFAEPALTPVNRVGINFLSHLREKDAAAADTRYNALLASAAANSQSDANTVSILSSYIFTPHLFVIFSSGGVNTSQESANIKPADVSPELRTAFFQAAAAILLRPLPAPGHDPGAADLDVRYLVIKRLLPFFEQFAPADMLEAVRGHLNALNAVVSDQTRRRDDEWIGKGIKPEKPAAEREQSLLDRLERAKTSAERDSLYIQLASLNANKGEMSAREFASKVEDSEVRKQVQAYIDGSLALTLIKKKNIDLALDVVHKGDLTPLQKAYVLTECAKIVAKTDRDKASDLIDEAATEARRIDVSDPSLPRALIAVANALKTIDATKVWDAAFDAVKAANSAERFTGEDGEIVLKFQSKGSSSVYSTDVADFDLNGIFRDLADQDYDRAVELARGFQGEGPRALATIAIARAVLEPRPQKGTKETKR
jgi:hypothetical protein